jgi:hypothetical protein
MTRNASPILTTVTVLTSLVVGALLTISFLGREAGGGNPDLMAVGPFPAGHPIDIGRDFYVLSGGQSPLSRESLHGAVLKRPLSKGQILKPDDVLR